ncbi:MAG: hypothetical protein M3O26_02365 [Pseudomonadota bacterium]|nr:hypothetical protein [Pseudomonadota bacterium]
MGLLDTLKQYVNPGAAPAGDVFGHFDTVAQQSSPKELGSGIAAALRSDATPSLGETIGNLFGQSNPEQKAGVLNEIIQSMGATGLATAGGGILGRILGSGTQSPSTPITPAQAAQVSPSEAGTLAATAHQQDSSIVDRLGSFYAQHPTLVKTLGVAALGAVMSHMSQRA